MTDACQDDRAIPRGLMPASLASRAWLAARGIRAASAQPWQTDIVLGAALVPTRFELHISSRGWGYLFCCGDRVTEIELTDLPSSIRIRDPHRLFAATPPLASIGAFVCALERRYQIELLRHEAAIQCSIAGAEPIVRGWIATL